jgi:uncharacterized protein with NRDE domain
MLLSKPAIEGLIRETRPICNGFIQHAIPDCKNAGLVPADDVGKTRTTVGHQHKAAKTMCLIAWNWQPNSATPLLLIANRDEFYARPSAALHWWQDGRVLAGKDLHGGGTWLGVDRLGRLAALTNYRDPQKNRPGARSRGQLVSGFLQGDLSAHDYLARLSHEVDQFNPFNLLLFDGQQLLGFESQNARCLAMVPGIGAVSNAHFNTPWPKLARLKAALAPLEPSTADARLFDILFDRTVPVDAELPRTGIPLEMERALAPAFIVSPDYGTRASSVVRIHRAKLEFVERSFDGAGTIGEQRFGTAD